jgi:hypothetical protein
VTSYVDAAVARVEMVELQLRRRGIRDERVLEAMARVPRDRFVPESLSAHAYEDGALPIGHDQTISQPFVVATICALLGLHGSEQGWHVFKDLITFMEHAWQRPDDGIWEVRGGRRHFTHSKVMAWVFFDRAAKGIQQFGLGGDEGQKMLLHICALREKIHAEICERGFNPRVGAFPQSYGSEVLDASVLVIPYFGFLPAADPRVQSTVKAIEKGLLRDGFVLRYDTKNGTDGLPGSEGAFRARSGWPITRVPGARTKRASCSSVCSRSATTWGFSRRSMTLICVAR